MTKHEKLLMDLAAAVRLGEDAMIEAAVDAAVGAGEALLDREAPVLDLEPEEEDDTKRPDEAAPCLVCGAPTCAGCGACGEIDCACFGPCSCEEPAPAAPAGPLHMRSLDGTADPRCGATEGRAVYTPELLAAPAASCCPTCRQIAVILAGPADDEAEA